MDGKQGKNILIINGRRNSRFLMIERRKNKMKNKKIKCYEVEVKVLVRNECIKKNLKEEIENLINSISYQIEDLEVVIK